MAAAIEHSVFSNGDSVAYPFWVNHVDALPVPSTAIGSLIELRDLFHCNTEDPAEQWQDVLLSSYLTDLSWVLAEVPELSTLKGNLILLSGEKGTATMHGSPSSPGKYTRKTVSRVPKDNSIVMAFKEYEQRRGAAKARALSLEQLVVLEPPLPIAYGTHHTKMALCVNQRGLRVCIFTANLIAEDWLRKTQGIYVQDFPWREKLSTSAPRNCSRKALEFEHHLRCYLSQCGLNATNACPNGESAAKVGDSTTMSPFGVFSTDFLSRIDFSDARVWLVSSVPGSHKGEVAKDYHVGMNRLGEVISRLTHTAQNKNEGPSSAVLSWQYSSQGSLKPTFLTDLQASMGGCEPLLSGSQPVSVSEVQIIYPTEEEVRNSIEGWRGGGSLPLRLQACHPFVNERLHRWGLCHDVVDVDYEETEPKMARYRQFALPHIKSYGSLTQDRQALHWFLLTSANLSQAAWGSYGVSCKQPRSLFVRSYELGVVYDASSAICLTKPRFSTTPSTVSRFLVLPSTQTSSSVLYGVPFVSSAGHSNGYLYLPYPILNPQPYASTTAWRQHRSTATVETGTVDAHDVPWVLDIPHVGLDALSLDVATAFAAPLTSAVLSRWRPRFEDGLTGPRKRRRSSSLS